MLIALLAILGVNLIVIVILAALVIGRRRWLKRQDGWFPGAARVTSGDVHGFSPRWKRGSGRWVSDVLVWSKAPFFYRDELVPVDRVSGERNARAGEIKRLGDGPVVISFASGEATIDVAGKAEMRDRVIGSLTPARAPN
jgi:hypothetical protein